MQMLTITVEHSASSYGLPVAQLDGEPFGPGDLLCIDGEYLTGAQAFERWAALPERTASERSDAARILRLA